MPITDPAQVTPDWLTDILRRSHQLDAGAVVSVTTGESMGAMSTVIPLHLSYSNDAAGACPKRLILKIADHANSREIQFYRTLAPAMTDPPCIICFDAANDEVSDKSHLLLEDLSETHQPHPPSQIAPLLWQSEGIVDALAKFHAHWWDQSRDGPTADLIQQEINWHAAKFPAFVDYLGDRLSEARKAIYERLFTALPLLLIPRYTSGKGLTYIHGDPHIGNFLYPRDPKVGAVRILDWKSWGVDMGVKDMAHMMAVFWFPERRARFEMELLKRYHHTLTVHGVSGYDWDTCWYDYRLSVLRLMLYPIWQWDFGMPPDIWWNHLERLMQAYQDLNCEELIA